MGKGLVHKAATLLAYGVAKHRECKEKVAWSGPGWSAHFGAAGLDMHTLDALCHVTCQTMVPEASTPSHSKMTHAVPGAAGKVAEQAHGASRASQSLSRVSGVCCSPSIRHLAPAVPAPEAEPYLYR